MNVNAIYLTKKQILSMAMGGSDGKSLDECHDVIISIEGGDMVIHSAANLMSLDDFEGSGVYLDASGNEHYGPGYPFERSKTQDEFHSDPAKWLDTHARYIARQAAKDNEDD